MGIPTIRFDLGWRELESPFSVYVVVYVVFSGSEDYGVLVQ